VLSLLSYISAAASLLFDPMCVQNVPKSVISSDVDSLQIFVIYNRNIQHKNFEIPSNAYTQSFSFVFEFRKTNLHDGAPIY